MARQGVDDQSRSRLVQQVSGPPNRSVKHAPGPLAGHWWVWPLCVYAVARLINVVMIVIASREAISTEEFVALGFRHFQTRAGQAPPGYLSSATDWDGQWYWEIAVNGYPSDPPTDASGSVQQNPWAFFPLYPYLVRLVMIGSGLDFPVAAVCVSVLFGAVATLLLYRLVALKSDRLGARMAVLGLNTFVCAPVFQIAYSESLALTLVLAILLATAGRRWVVTGGLLVLLGVTRGAVAPFAGVFAAMLAVEWRRSRRAGRPLVPYAVLAALAGGVTFLWPGIAAWVTGATNAYFVTQTAWNPDAGTMPVVRFVDRIAGAPGGVALGWLVALAWAFVLLWVLTVGQQNSLLRTWTATYAMYILAVVDWNWSAVRYYLLALPIFWPLTAISPGNGRKQRVLLGSIIALLGIAAQWWWIRYAVTLSPEVVQVP